MNDLIEKVKHGLKCHTVHVGCNADKEICPYYADEWCSQGLANDALSVIEHLSVANKLIRQQGKWIPYMPEYGDMFKCSECDYIIRLAFKAPGGKCPYGYCPKCGAIMREVEGNG